MDSDGLSGGRREFDLWEIIFVCLVFIIGLAIRIRLAYLNYLNPDEVEMTLFALGSLSKILRHALLITHPPMMEAILWFVCKISRNELWLRLTPLLAGSLCPLLLYFWLRRVAGSVAAMAVFFLLTLSPYNIALSVQLRPYALALFFVSAALLALEIALESPRWQMMAVYSGLLWLCIVADYSTAWFVGAAGVFVLLRLRGLSREVRIAWALGQVGAVALYAFLFAIQVALYRGNNAVALDALNGFLRNEFPQSGGMLAFPFTHTLGQFEYLMAWTPLGWMAAALFAAAIFLLWTGRTGIERSKARALAVLLVLPFLLGIAGAFARQFPYGSTRHTIVLGVFAATGVAILLGTLPRRVGLPIVWGMLLLAPLWSLVPLREDIPPERHRKAQILAALDYMRTTIPPGSLIFTERDTINIITYYDGQNELPPWPDAKQSFSENLFDDTWRIAARDYGYNTPEEYRDGLAAFRRQYHLAESEPVWVLDGGWAVVSGPPDPRLPFTQALRVFQAVGQPGQAGQHGF